MKTPEEIKKGLACHMDGLGPFKPCSDCTYHGKGLKPCRIAVHEDALAYMEQLEERIALMMIQMKGDCGVCKHRGKPDRCNECLAKYGRPLWEYEGLPEVARKENV